MFRLNIYHNSKTTLTPRIYHFYLYSADFHCLMCDKSFCIYNSIKFIALSNLLPINAIVFFPQGHIIRISEMLQVHLVNVALGLMPCRSQFYFILWISAPLSFWWLRLCLCLLITVSIHLSNRQRPSLIDIHKHHARAPSSCFTTVSCGSRQLS